MAANFKPSEMKLPQDGDSDFISQFTFLNFDSCSTAEKNEILNILGSAEENKKVEEEPLTSAAGGNELQFESGYVHQEHQQQQLQHQQALPPMSYDYTAVMSAAPTMVHNYMESGVSTAHHYGNFSAPPVSNLHPHPPTVYINNMTANVNVHHPTMGGHPDDHPQMQQQGQLHYSDNQRYSMPVPPPPAMLPAPQFNNVYTGQVSKGLPYQVGGVPMFSQFPTFYPCNFPYVAHPPMAPPPLAPPPASQLPQRPPLVRSQMVQPQNHLYMPLAGQPVAPSGAGHFNQFPAPPPIPPVTSVIMTAPSSMLPPANVVQIGFQEPPTTSAATTTTKSQEVVEEDIEKAEVESYGFEIPDEVEDDEPNQSFVGQIPEEQLPSSPDLAQEQKEEPQEDVEEGEEELETQAAEPLIDQDVQPEEQTRSLTPAGPKSWASLFHKESRIAGDSSKPMARIHPFSSDKSTDDRGDGHSPDASALGLAGSHSKQEVALAKFLKNYVLSHKSQPLKPRGLSNRSNWCFVNSILQALVACPPFFNLIKSLPEEIKAADAYPGPSGSSSVKLLAALHTFMSEFTPLENFPRMNHRKNKKSEDLPLGKTLEATSILQVLLTLTSDTFHVVEGRQEDAEEFLTFFLNGINDEMVALLKLVDEPTNVEQRSSNNNSAAEEDDSEWKEVGPKNRSCVTRRGGDLGAPVCIKSPIAELFQGQVRSSVSRSAGETTATLQPFFTLQLDIQAEGIKNVSDALARNFNVEQIDGFICSRTKQQIEASRSLLLEELPPILVLHLKRFLYSETSGGCQKFLKNIDFPVDLEIPREILSTNSRNKYQPRQRQYKLFAVVYHNGTEATKGHYVTDIYHTGLGTWLRCDDSQLKAMPESYVLAHSASSLPYILFYRRGDTMGGGSSDKSKHVNVPASSGNNTTSPA